LHGHIPATKGNEAGTLLGVKVVEWNLKNRCGHENECSGLAKKWLYAETENSKYHAKLLAMQ
jgi:hypothetical protein